MIHLVKPDTLVELRRVPVDYYSVGTERVIDVELVANATHAEGTIGCTQAGWLQISIDGGASYAPITTTVMGGASLGAFVAGTRKAAKIKIAVPGGTQVRQRSVGLIIGEGT